MKIKKSAKRITSIAVVFAMLMLALPAAFAENGITSDIYTVEADTIGGVLPQTVLHDFLQRLSAEKGEEPTLWRGGERIYSGYVENGDILKCGSEEYTVSVSDTVMFNPTETIKDLEDGTELYSKASGAAFAVGTMADYGFSLVNYASSNAANSAEITVEKGSRNGAPYYEISTNKKSAVYFTGKISSEDYASKDKYLVTEFEIEPMSNGMFAIAHGYDHDGKNRNWENYFPQDNNSGLVFGTDRRCSIGINNSSLNGKTALDSSSEFDENTVYTVKMYRKILGDSENNLRANEDTVSEILINGKSYGPYSYAAGGTKFSDYKYIDRVMFGIAAGADNEKQSVRYSGIKVYIADSHPSAVNAAELTDSGNLNVVGSEISGIYSDENLTAGEFLDRITVSDKAAKLVLDSEDNIAEKSAPLADGMKLKILSANGENVNIYTLRVEQRPKITASILPYVSLEAGQTLSAAYEAIAPFIVDNVTYRWLVSETKDGIYTEIENETKSTLVLTNALWKKYVKAEITPVGENEVSVSSAAVGPITDKKADFVETVNKSTYSDIKDNIIAAADFYDEIAAVIKPIQDDYKLHLISLNLLKGIPYADFDSFAAALADCADNINAAFADSAAVSLESVASNEGNITDGHVNNTPRENIFKYGGKEFIVIDSTDNEMYVITKDYYGTKAAHTDEKGIYDALDEKSIAFFLNRSFITDGNEGYSLPNGILNHINYDKVWISEPQSGMNATKTVGGIGLLSATEYKKYAPRIGEDDIPSGAVLYYLRTPNAEYANHMLGLSLRVLNSVPTYGSFIGSKANAVRHLRPAFYLNKSFFENNKLTAAGSDAARRIASMCSEAKLRELYTDEEIDIIFSKPQIKAARISGRPIVGNTLTADYEYESEFEEKDTQFEWLSSAAADGAYLPIDGKRGKELIVDSSLAGKFIKVKITPGSVLAINHRGDAYTTAATACAAMTVEEADRAAALLNEVSEEALESYLTAHEAVFGANAMMRGLSPELKTVALKHLAQSDFTTMADFDSDMNTCIAMAKLSAAANEEIEGIIADSESAVNKKDYADLADKTAVNAYIKTASFTGAEDFAEKVNNKIAVTYFNLASKSDIVSVLKRFSDKLTKDISKLTEQQLSALGDAVLKVDSYADMTAVNNKIDEVYSSVIKNNPAAKPPVSGSGNSSNKGGSGGGGISVGAVKRANDKDDTNSYFNDMQGYEWAEASVKSLADKGIINGVGNGSFAPAEKLTREQFVKMLVLAFGFKASGAENPFEDVSANQWYTEYISAAYENGIAFGITESRFGIGEMLTKEQMITFIYRALEKAGLDVKSGNSAVIGDKESVSQFAAAALEKLSAAGIVSGDENGYFNPSQTAERAMAAVVIYKTLENAEENNEN